MVLELGQARQDVALRASRRLRRLGLVRLLAGGARPRAKLGVLGLHPVERDLSAGDPLLDFLLLGLELLQLLSLQPRLLVGGRWYPNQEGRNALWYCRPQKASRGQPRPPRFRS